ncbi:hypothetical protein [Bacillus inaquosorum]|nr:hypothetical protein [Bacillus inaquosorum]
MTAGDMAAFADANAKYNELKNKHIQQIKGQLEESKQQVQFH